MALLVHFKKFTDRLESFTNKVLTKHLSKVFLQPLVLKIIKWYNLLLLFFFNIAFVGYYFHFPIMQSLSDYILIIFGMNLFAFIPQGFLTFKFKFCTWSKLAFICDFICYLLNNIQMLTKGRDGEYSAAFVYFSLFLLLFTIIYTGITYRKSDTDATTTDSGVSSPK